MVDSGRRAWFGTDALRYRSGSEPTLWIDLGTLVVFLFLGGVMASRNPLWKNLVWVLGSIAVTGCRAVVVRRNPWEVVDNGPLVRGELISMVYAFLFGLWALVLAVFYLPPDDPVLTGITLTAGVIWWVSGVSLLAPTPFTFLALSVPLGIGCFAAAQLNETRWQSRAWMMAPVGVAVFTTYVDRRRAWVRSFISERRQQALAAELQLAFDRLSHGVAVTLDGRVVRTNSVLNSLLRLHPEESKGRFLAEVFGLPPGQLVEAGVHRVSGPRPGTGDLILTVEGRGVPDGPEVVVWDCRDVTDEADAQERLRTLADHDDLTGLGNRRALVRRLDGAVRRGAPVAVLVIDVDNFKQINDRYGHSVGDDVLNVVAQRLLRAVGQDGVVFRPGGDEFVVLLGGSRDATGHQLVQDACRRAADLVAGAQSPVAVGVGPLQATLSIGVAVSIGGAVPADAERARSAVLHDADRAMYRAKRAGRNAWRATPVPAEAAATFDRVIQEQASLRTAPRDRPEHDR